MDNWPFEANREALHRHRRRRCHVRWRQGDFSGAPLNVSHDNLLIRKKLLKLALGTMASEMKTLMAKPTTYGCGPPINLARTESASVAKHGPPVVVVTAVEEFERLKATDTPTRAEFGG